MKAKRTIEHVCNARIGSFKESLKADPSIEHNFKYHPPVGNAAEIHGAIRKKAQELAQLIDETLPARAGRERALAITKCEEAMMWACAGVARHSGGKNG